MSSSCENPTTAVALIGNPNTGKSTLFSALVGVHQRVGNYPGVTVEKRTGQLQHAGRDYTLIDLPGLYSLTPRSGDEMVSVDVLLGRRDHAEAVAAVICVVDASNLERNLYLVSQVLEFQLPTIVALNMPDVAADRGIAIDLPGLRQRLQVPVVPIQANRRLGLADLLRTLDGVLGSRPQVQSSAFPAVFQAEVDQLAARLAGGDGKTTPLPRCLVQQLLLDESGALQRLLLPQAESSLADELQQSRTRLAAAGCGVSGLETTVRYEWVQQQLDGVVTHPPHYHLTATDRADRLLTHRVWGTLVFALVMLAMFQSVFVWAEPLMHAIEAGICLAGRWSATWLAEGALRSLLVDGVIGGVGGVLKFLPQIAILFLFLGVLEDCGYMARAAFLMDSLMTRVGLSGQSFIPLLSSFGCAVPGIMATRVIENHRDRLTTILVAPLLTCSARLPVYGLLIAAFIPARSYWGGLVNLQGLTLAGLYLLGIVAAMGVAQLFKRTVLRGETPPFFMELPSYKWPSPRNVLLRIVERALAFVRLAGSVVLALSVLVWAALYYPHGSEVAAPFAAEKAQLQAALAGADTQTAAQQAVASRLAQLDREIAGAYQRQSLLGRVGRFFEPLVRPLGWDWRIGCAVISAFPAREVVVATLGVIFNLGEEAPEEHGPWQSRLQAVTREDSDQPLFDIPVALSIMVFFALCAQCMATLAVIRQETNSWRWPIFTFTYMTGLAYLAALVTYQLGSRIGVGS